MPCADFCFQCSKSLYDELKAYIELEFLASENDARKASVKRLDESKITVLSQGVRIKPMSGMGEKKLFVRLSFLKLKKQRRIVREVIGEKGRFRVLCEECVFS